MTSGRVMAQISASQRYARLRGQARSYEKVLTRSGFVGAGLPAKKRSEPYSIPQWVVTDLFDQSGAQWIGDYIARHRPQVFLLAHGMIMVSRLPEGPCPPCQAV